MIRSIGRFLTRHVFAQRLGATSYVLRTALFTLLTVYPIVLTVALLQYLVSPLREAAAMPLSLVSVLLFAPFFENFVFIGMLEFLLAFQLRKSTMVLVVATLSGIAHGLVAEWRAVSGFIGFATMSYTYLDWHRSIFLKRYAMTVMQHLLFNATGVVLVLLTGFYDDQ